MSGSHVEQEREFHTAYIMDRLRILVHYMNVMQSFADSIKNEQIRLIWEQLSVWIDDPIPGIGKDIDQKCQHILESEESTKTFVVDEIEYKLKDVLTHIRMLLADLNRLDLEDKNQLSRYLIRVKNEGKVSDIRSMLTIFRRGERKNSLQSTVYIRTLLCRMKELIV
jgi:hypothetical protein